MLRVGRYTFQPRWFIVLVYILIGGTMLRLGVWQLQQAERKEIILAAIERAGAAEPVELATLALDTLDERTAAANAHTRVLLTGQYRSDQQFLWDNRVHAGQAGFEVITPVQLADGRMVLVNRGWVAPGATRSQLPDVALLIGSDDSVSIDGYFSSPSKGLASGDAIVGDKPWPKVLQYFDYASMSKVLGAPLVPGVIQPQQLNKPVLRDDFLIANWEPTATIGPARHYGYSFQWFAMAFALTVLFIVYNTRTTGSPA